jgi:hypothetical protein
MPNMKTLGQRNLLWVIGILRYWVDKEKPKDSRMPGRTDGCPDGQADSSIPPLQLYCVGYKEFIISGYVDADTETQVTRIALTYSYPIV